MLFIAMLVVCDSFSDGIKVVDSHNGHNLQANLVAATFYYRTWRLLTFLAIVLHICISEWGQHWFRWWLVAYFAPSHYVNQCWVIVNWPLRNKLQWNFNQNTNIFINKNASETTSGKWWPFSPGGDELMQLDWCRWNGHAVTLFFQIFVYRVAD